MVGSEVVAWRLVELISEVVGPATSVIIVAWMVLVV